ncbi:proprotein convertase P-domain-containing protein [Myxococcota bacterium]|nr:proprotein convertase P-domain-containing protein [Myxococcota bacterium]MBU1896451.1 proprotein convertase P-domain-containing protein [Myxococcota bacterium]
MRLICLFLCAPLLFAACGDEASEPNTPTPPVEDSSDEAPLMDLDVLLEGAPDPSTLPDEAKADQVFPKRFDLVEFQSPVKSQGRRGVCSIFSTIALMEHLYIREGTFSAPDFSEQFLQWSVKAEVGAFQKTAGSNAGRNLEAIARYGVVEESIYPYDPNPWNSTHDERCAGDDRPMVCHTNGEPSDEVKNAKRWKLPSDRWISSRVNNIKSFMFENKVSVVAGGQFFYQSWNHGSSTLPISNEYKMKGYILSPNDEDHRLSTEKRAGHSILLVGWDDDLSVPMLDKEGKKIVGADGQPVMETGFFLFKNSWGTGAFGTENPFGAGYGWISMRYVEDHMSISGTTVPKLTFNEPEVCDDGVDNNGDLRVDCDDPKCASADECVAPPAVEVCDDGVDNNEDGAVDCADEGCAETEACQAKVLHGESQAALEIPDNQPSGVLDSILIDGEGQISRMEVHVEIAHSYQGDLVVRLYSPTMEMVTLQSREGQGTDDLRKTFDVKDFVGQNASGEWILEVSDHAGTDTGTLEGWRLDIWL